MAGDQGKRSGQLVGGVRSATVLRRPAPRWRMTSLVCRAESPASSPQPATAVANPSPPVPTESAMTASLTQLSAGALAGLVNTLVLSPLDVAKTRMQVGSATRGYTGTLNALRTMLKEEGVVAWYRGLSAALWAFVPNWAIWWVTYEAAKRRYAAVRRSRAPNSPMTYVHVAAAVSAGAVTAVTTSPLWVLKARLQTDIASGAKRRYRSVPHGLARIVREEGFGGLYKGLSPSLLGLGHVAVQFPLYEYIKRVLSNGSENDVQPRHVLIASSLSKIVASTMFYPHEVIRTRLQVDRTIMRTGEVSRVATLVKGILTEHGIRGFYRGYSANLARTVPAAALTFSSYEFAKRFVERRTRKRKRDDEGE